MDDHTQHQPQEEPSATLTVEQAQEIANYLAARPWREVNHLIGYLSQGVNGG